MILKLNSDFSFFLVSDAFMKERKKIETLQSSAKLTTRSIEFFTEWSRGNKEKWILRLFHLKPSVNIYKNPMTSASSMNHAIIRKSIKNQSKKQKTENGDILRHTNHRKRPKANISQSNDSLQPFIPSPDSSSSSSLVPRKRTTPAIVKYSLWFYAVSSVIFALCCLSTPTIAAQNITQQPLPL